MPSEWKKPGNIKASFVLGKERDTEIKELQIRYGVSKNY